MATRPHPVIRTARKIDPSAHRSDQNHDIVAVNDRYQLNLITDGPLCEKFGLVETVKEAVRGGVTLIQIRAKHATTTERIKIARDIKNALVGTNVPIIMNDDVIAAVEADIDGAHIGQTDMSPRRARTFLGPKRILGLSCETAQHVRAVDPQLINYLGLGPVFGTDTKPDHAEPIGFAGLAKLVRLTCLPTLAIGGLTAAHVADIKTAGADGLAVISAICGTPDPYAAAQEFYAPDNVTSKSRHPRP